MNKDLIIGVVVSVALHSTILFLGQKSPPPKKIAPPKEEVVQFEMPPLDEEKPDKVEDLNEEPVENQLAPPSLIDLPTIVPIEAFTQPLTPPPPPGMIASGAITIPVLKPGANFGKGIANLFDINNLDQRPTARVQPQPAYPYEMSRAGISGDVVVEFIINENGDVIDRRAADQLTRTGYFEALGDGLFCLLHEESGAKQRTPVRLASVLSDK